MRDIVLACCGEAVPAPPRDLDCPSCGTHFSAHEVDQLQTQEITDLPVVDVVRAAAMLGQSAAWIGTQRASLEPLYNKLGLGFVFPITAIRRFAQKQGIKLTPRSVGNGVFELRFMG